MEFVDRKRSLERLQKELVLTRKGVREKEFTNIFSREHVYVCDTGAREHSREDVCMCDASCASCRICDIFVSLLEMCSKWSSRTSFRVKM